MNILERLKNHSEDNIGVGIEYIRIGDLEKKLNIQIPKDFKDYLLKLNYAELYGDPIYGINDDMAYIDLYEQNYMKEHFKYGFLEIFSNDIDGTIYLRPDNGKIYNATFTEPIADSFNQFVKKLLDN